MSKLKKMIAKRRLSLLGVFVLFSLLFNAPFLNLPQGSVHGIPSLMVYISTIWFLVIIIMALMSQSKEE